MAARFLTNLFLPKAALAARVLAAESQLAICRSGWKAKDTPSLFLRRLPVVVGPAGRLWEEMAEVCSADATGHSQTLAGVGIWTFLALEILPPSWTTGDFKATAGGSSVR